jgi:hypothetical protein
LKNAKIEEYGADEVTDDANRPGTEELDGQRAGEVRRLKARRMSEALQGRSKDLKPE